MSARRWSTLALALLPALLCFALAWPHTSGSPEPVELRTYLREPALPLGPNAWLTCDGMPEHLAGRAAYQALLRTGCDYPCLARFGQLVAALTFALVLWLATRGARSPPVLPLLAVAALLFSPAFGANWLLVERVRVFAPALAAAAMVVLLRRASAWRFVAALAVSLFALLTHETGSLLWGAVIPLVVAPREAGTPFRFRALALWLLLHNVALALCYDESARAASPGLVRACLADPAATLGFLGRTLTAVLPDLLPNSAVDQTWLAVALVILLAVGGLVCWRRLRDAEALAPSWWCLALAGFAQALAIAHAQVPPSITDAILREVAWGTWLLPAGLVGLAVQLAPRVMARVGPYLVGAALVAVAQDWRYGVQHLRDEAAYFRQREALLVFADLGRELLPAMAVPAVAEPTQRAWLRRKGLLRRAAPTDRELTGLVAANDGASAGELAVLAPQGARGTVHRAASTDVVLLLRQVDGAAPQLAKVALPNVLGSGAELIWQVDLGELRPFVDGEVVTAVGFDLRRRALLPLAGRFKWTAGQFVASEAVPR